MFKADLIERAAHFRSAEDDPSRKLDNCPALVLNADYTPLSYYPLSLWPWQTAIKAIFLERVDVVATYERMVHSPSLDMQIPSVIALRQYVKPSEFPAFTRFNLFLRDRFSCQYCGSQQHLTFDHVDALEEDRLDRGLPRPNAERIVRERRVIGVEHQRRAAFQLPDRVLLRAPEMRGAIDQFGLEHLVSSLR